MITQTDIISLKPISDLLKEDFFVPSYQRGYRWTETEVKALLDDIYEFIIENEQSKKEVFYCLQPLIVYYNQNKYYVIDGQQRLTTLYIILTYLKDVVTILGKSLYDLTYETRPDSERFLKTINDEEANDNVDFFHINNAYKAVSDWFQDKDGVLKMKMVSTITATNTEGKNVKFIWYEIKPEDAIDVFTRINIGKIPLTNAELIKALFIREKNFTKYDQEKKISISTEWDEIERSLSDDKFWYFLSNTENNIYDNKIEYLLDIISKKNKDNEKLHTFFYFNKQIEEAKKEDHFNVDNLWLLVKEKFQILDEWYNNHALYHYIGYLFAIDYNVRDILKLSEKKDKTTFIKDIKLEIKKQFKNVDLDALSFDKNADKKIIKKILLLFNIETILQSQKSYLRFPFDKYKTENWDIEHINPQNPFDKIEHYVVWCMDTMEYLTGETLNYDDLLKDNAEFENTYEELILNLDEEHKTIVDEIIDILNDKEDFKPKTEELAAKLFKKYKGYESENNDQIFNLTLLDAVTNRSYGNSLFPIKRNTIIKNDKSGVFIPICTKNVFLKYYSKKFTDVMFWKEEDAKAYQENIEQVLSFYLPKAQ